MMCAAVSPSKLAMYVRAAALDASSADPFTASHVRAVDRVGPKPVDDPIDLPVVDGSDTVDMERGCFLRDVFAASGHLLWTEPAGEGANADAPAREAARMAAAVANFIV